MAAPQSPYLYLRTRGRRSGLWREIEIWYTEHDGKYYVIAEYPASHWVQNLQRNVRCEVRIAGRQTPAIARMLDPAADHEVVRNIQELSRGKYGWGDGLVVELTLHPPANVSEPQ
jgi:deazaflavin-dependent oxidoreductase (nitroreductase family)